MEDETPKSDQPNVNGSGDAGTSDGSGGSKSPIAAGEMTKGKCKWFNVLKGFGFVTPDDGSDDVFVHQSVLKMGGFRSLEEGEPVEYQARPTERGVEACVVTGPQHADCHGSSVRPLGRRRRHKIRCFNCGRFGNHTASKCRLPAAEKSCYHCKATDHLIAQCPQRPVDAAAANDNDNAPPEAPPPNGDAGSDPQPQPQQVEQAQAQAAEE